MRLVFLSLFFVLGLCVHTCLAGIGGATVWTVKVTTTTKDPSSECGEPNQISVVGDDGVVVMRICERIFEIVPQSVGSPIVRKVQLEGIPLEAIPLARVGGRTIVYVRPDLFTRRLQWIGEGEKLISIPSSNGEFAVAENGDIFSTSILDERAYLTKWSTNGEIVFRKALGRYANARAMVLGPEGTLFIAMQGGISPPRLFAINSDGEQLWSTNLGNDGQAPVPYRPTSSGELWVDDTQGGFSRLTVDGFPAAILPRERGFDSGFALSPTDEAVASFNPGAGYSPGLLLADGGFVYPLGPFVVLPGRGAAVIIRHSSIGTRLWTKRVDPSFRGPVSARIGNGLAYFSAWIQTGDSYFECYLSAVDLGAPAADSACPFTGTIWPDGSHRARRRSHAPPTVTMIGKPRHSGAVIEFGVEDDLRYSVETADKADGPWRSVGTVTGAGYGARFTDPTSVGDPMRLYRVRRSP